MLLAGLSLAGAASVAVAQVGLTLPELTVAQQTYHEVRVLAVTPLSVTVRHRGGLAQLELRLLSPELQEKFGYNATAAARAAEELERDRRRREEEAREPQLDLVGFAPVRTPVAGGDTAVGRAMARFGTPVVRQDIDLRPQFRELGLELRRQGLRPSCSVFAVVSALEYQSAASGGRAEQLSEEYLIWATRRTLGLPAGVRRQVVVVDEGEEELRDAGFSLQEVLAALRAYGIPLQSEMPNRMGFGMEDIAPPDETLIAQARARRQVSTYLVPGATGETRVANVMHALNEGVPVVVGLAWPSVGTLRKTALISRQSPREGSYHAVTLVGYYSASGALADTRFIFRNSWGIRWGTGGHGFVDIAYLQAHLCEAVVLEVGAGGINGGPARR